MVTSIRTKQQEKDAKEKQAQQATEDAGLLLKLESLEARSIDHFSRKCLRKYFLVKTITILVAICHCKSGLKTAYLLF